MRYLIALVTHKTTQEVLETLKTPEKIKLPNEGKTSTTHHCQKEGNFQHTVGLTVSSFTIPYFLLIP